VYACHECGHVQSVEIAGIDQYYDTDYDILVSSEEEDQIYQVVDGIAIYRTEHQVHTLLDKVVLSAGSTILDYGCAKSATMRILRSGHSELHTYLFDVSDRYVSFWSAFLSEEHWATHVIPTSWNGRFDAVTSFFSLEHMARPQDALQQIHRLLKTGGIFYGIVPNVFSNTADMIVVDHVSHFTVPSLTHLLRGACFEVVEIDTTAHRGALIFVAKKIGSKSVAVTRVEEIQNTVKAAKRIAQYWKGAGENVQAFEDSLDGVDRIAIYGAGFYGAFLTACLRHPHRIACIVDQNPFLQGRSVNGARIVAPADLPDDIRVVLVGLNPAYAAKCIGEIEVFRDRDLKYFFL
jgi:SAM-dependent methyltransferase